MTTREAGSVPRSLRIVRLGSAVATLVAMAACSDLAATWRASPRASVARRVAPSEPIPAEAEVFRTRPGDLAVDTGAVRRGEAHPRSLATYRGLRAYPGAPPRVPHGLTTTEYRTTGCGTCHERGGYSLRFGAYVPVTPHPELADCLSCHVPDAAVVGVELPTAGPEGACRQCHAPSVRVASVTPLDWRSAAWPVARRHMPDGTPPPIPHDLALRGNCNACHMGPAAVAEIRTTHPERADCRQCHVAEPAQDSVSEDGAYARPGGEP